MSREITSSREAIQQNANATVPATETPSTYKDRLVKLIPSEIITAYVTIYGLVSVSEKGDKSILLWLIIAILFVLTPIYLLKISKVTKWPQIAFSSFGFLIWVFATGSPISEILNFPTSFIASLVLIIYTLFIPLFYKG